MAVSETLTVIRLRCQSEVSETLSETALLKAATALLKAATMARQGTRVVDEVVDEEEPAPVDPGWEKTEDVAPPTVKPVIDPSGPTELLPATSTPLDFFNLMFGRTSSTRWPKPPT